MRLGWPASRSRRPGRRAWRPRPTGRTCSWQSTARPVARGRRGTTPPACEGGLRPHVDDGTHRGHVSASASTAAARVAASRRAAGLCPRWTKTLRRYHQNCVNPRYARKLRTPPRGRSEQGAGSFFATFLKRLQTPLESGSIRRPRGALLAQPQEPVRTAKPTAAMQTPTHERDRSANRAPSVTLRGPEQSSAVIPAIAVPRAVHCAPAASARFSRQYERGR